MSDAIAALTDKERETLRLLLRGHDAKSSARELGLSVHTINERLREARRKLGVTSSREAARLLLESEGDHENFGYSDLGEAATASPDHSFGQPNGRHGDGRPARRPIAWWIGGIAIMSALLALLLVASPMGSTPAPQPLPAATQAADAEVESAARNWLGLVDAGDWAGSYAATGSAFRKLNTQEMWEKASRANHADLGSVKTRELVSVRYLNAPPNGFKEVAFRSKYSSGREVLETVTLEQENGAWRVVGCIVE